MQGNKVRKKEKGARSAAAGEDLIHVNLKKGSVIGGQWKIVNKIGEGGCGSVFKVQNISTKAEAALKAESNFVPGGSVLKLEVTILQRLQGKSHVCQLLHSGKRHQYSYMIMTLLGPSLANLLKKCGRQVTVSTQVRVGINVLYGLKQVHDTGFIHRDLKPANLAIGPLDSQGSHFIHILDFGLSREFVLPGVDGKPAMRRPRTRCLFRGTTRYCSLNTHEKGEQGRVDDLWSLVYFMAEMRGPLPWHTSRDKKEVADLKRNTTDKILLYNSPVQLLEFTQHLRELTYFSRPNYRFLYECLYEVMTDGSFKYADPYEWEDKLKRTSKSNERTSGETIANSRESTATGKEAMKVGGSKDSISAVASQPPQGSKESTESQGAFVAPPTTVATYGDPNNPFPVEDFEADPFGF